METASLTSTTKNVSAGRIPGYKGYIPGSQNLCGKRFSETTVDAREYTTRLLGGEKHAEMLELASERRPHTISRPGGTPADISTLQGPTQLCQTVREGRVPGYAGFCPGTKNNAIGARFARATVQGHDALQRALQQEGRSYPLVPNSGVGVGPVKVDPADVSQGHIPGYCGFTPGKKPYTVGLRFAESTHYGKLMVNDVQKEKVDKLAFVEPSRPQNGVAEMPTIHNPQKDIPTKGKIPGYTGHVPGTRNTFASTYYRSTDTDRTERGPYTTCEVGHTNQIPKSTFLKNGGIIPGYAGYIPGLKPRNVYGERFSGITTSAAREVKKPFRNVHHAMVKAS